MADNTTGQTPLESGDAALRDEVKNLKHGIQKSVKEGKASRLHHMLVYCVVLYSNPATEHFMHASFI